MSLFDHLRNFGFSHNDIITINRWRKALRKIGAIGQAIDRNCELESRVNDHICKELLRRIIERFGETREPLISIQKAISEAKNPYKEDQPMLDSLLLKGPEIKITLPDNFFRITGYISLHRYLTKIKYGASPEIDRFLENIQNQKYLPDKYYHNSEGFLWASDPYSYDHELEIDELRCRFGLPHFKLGEKLYKMTYSRDSVKGKCYFPTIVEARNSCFQPADENSNTGYTRGLKHNSQWYPEWVHESVKFCDLEIHPIGCISATTVPDGYLDNKLNRREARWVNLILRISGIFQKISLLNIFKRD